MTVDERDLLSRLGEVDPLPAEVSERATQALRAAMAAEVAESGHRPTKTPRHRRVGRPSARWLVAGAAGAAAVLGLATFGAFQSIGQPPATGRATTNPSGTAQTPRAVLWLASYSAAAPPFQGRYVVLAETDTETGYSGQSERTSVIDTLTGASTTYQQPYVGTDAPSVLTEGPRATTTEAWFAALPTDPTALRAKLLAIAQQQADQAGKATAQPVESPPSADDDVYQEADELLWSPLVQPALRAGLYQVLAGCSGFTVTSQATDPAGRPAIAMTRTYTDTTETDITYEDPTSGAVLAQVWTTPATNGRPGNTITAVYQPVTSTDTPPADPYAA